MLIDARVNRPVAHHDAVRPARAGAVERGRREHRFVRTKAGKRALLDLARRARRRHELGPEDRPRRGNVVRRATRAQRGELVGRDVGRHRELRVGPSENRHIARQNLAKRAARNTRAERGVVDSALQRAHPERTRVRRHRAHGASGVAALGKRAQRDALGLVVASPHVVRRREIAALVRLANLHLVRRERRSVRAKHLVEQLLPFAAREMSADDVVVRAVAKALVTEIVGDSSGSELLHATLDGAHLHGIDASDADREPVALEMATTQLVGVALGPQHAESVVLELADGPVDGHVHRHRLLRDGDAILHAREADRVLLHVEMPADHREHLGVRHVGLLHAEVDVLAFADWVVGGNLLDDEVLGPLLETAANAWHRRSARAGTWIDALVRRRERDPVFGRKHADRGMHRERRVVRAKAFRRLVSRHRRPRRPRSEARLRGDPRQPRG